MKKLYTLSHYKKLNAGRVKHREAQARKRKAIHKSYRRHQSHYKGTLPARKPTQHRDKNKQYIQPPIEAPEDLRLLTNTDQCIEFFNRIRRDDSVSHLSHNQKLVRLSLSKIKHIDYAAISLLTASADLLRSKRITISGDFPVDSGCKDFIIRSGFLNKMRDQDNKPYPKSEISTLIQFQSEKGILSQEANKNISRLLQETAAHLNNPDSRLRSLQTILMEICGNCVEWSQAVEKQRLVGIYKEVGKVTFTAVDLGVGILSTIKKKWFRQFRDSLGSPTKILYGAFEKKYGSASQEPNRARGLPSIKDGSDTGKIVNLTVITNNVRLCFTDSSISAKLSYNFSGTLYQWEVTEDSIRNIVR